MDFKTKYDEIKLQREKVDAELKLLEENEFVKKYFELKKQSEYLYNNQRALYKEVKTEEYKLCDHILVYSRIERDGVEGRSYKSCGCIKCGLDENVLNYPKEYLTFEQKVMFDYLDEKYLRGKETKYVCDLDLAKAIYAKIKEVHPEIDDATAIKYFEIALDNIRDIKVSDERKTNRAKRLSLNIDFQNWNGSDVISS